MVGKKSNDFNKLSSSQMLNLIIESAIDESANFIHIESRDTDISIRFRINGALIEYNKFPKKRYDSLIQKLKKLSNLDAKQRNITQEGKFKINTNNKMYSLSVTVIPTIYGEKLSINILDRSKDIMSLEELGYWGGGLISIKKALESRKGLILLTGQRDSGKSTSLASILNSISDPNLKISTIEDPVEIIINKINQTQVNPKTNLTFTNGLKIIEKNDSDVIMVSDLRDKETIKHVFQYSSHGKLIISSIFSNNSIEAINRLVISGINHHLISHSLKILINQKLVRKLCLNCSETFIPNKKNLDLIGTIFNLDKPNQMKFIHNLELVYINEHEKNESNTSENKIKKLWQAHEGGCENCHNTGYSGRIGLFEIIRVTPSIEALITSLASPKVILNKAINEGTVTILVDGLIKALQGETSINEIYRIYQDQ